MTLFIIASVFIVAAFGSGWYFGYKKGAKNVADVTAKYNQIVSAAKNGVKGELESIISKL